MRARAGGIIVLLATIVSLLVTISAPYIRAFDDVRVYFFGSAPSGEANAINAAIGRTSHRDDISTQRLSRELEEGFMDSDEDSDEEF